MSNLSKKVSYLRGFAEGLDISPKSDEGKLISNMLEVIDEMADKIDALEESQNETDAILDDIDEELSWLADDIYGEDDFSDDEDDDYEDEDEDDDWLNDDTNGADNDLFEIQCPNCGEDVMVDFDMLDEEKGIICPNCHEEIELEFNFDEDDD